MPLGERIFVGAIGGAGLFWTWQAARLPYWDGFAPGSGFLPMWLGIVLVALVAVLMVKQHLRPAPSAPVVATRHRRVWAIMLGLLVCSVLLPWIGFVVTIGGYLLYLLAFVERRRPMQTALVAGGTTLTLFLLFHSWLGVPLPTGPWGF